MEDCRDPPCCDSCYKPFAKKRAKKHEFRRRAIDPITNKLLVMCNACGLRLTRAGWRVKKEPPVKLTQTQKDGYIKEVTEFSKVLSELLNDDLASRLYCPVMMPKLCRCIQRHMAVNPNDLGSDKEITISTEKAEELLNLCKLAKRMVKEKPPRPKRKDVSLNVIKGVVNLRTKEYEEFVLTNRERLKKKYSLCERGVQRVLCYSNNYLHKQLKTSPNQKSRIPGKVEQTLPTVSGLSETRCCSRRCTRLAMTHSRLVESWRKRALSGQFEARTVLAEMLTPAGGSCNCPLFVHLVTGCSPGLLSKVKQQLKHSAGLHDPPEHGLREYWRQRKIKAAMNRNSSKEAAKSKVANTAAVKNGQVPSETQLSAIGENEISGEKQTPLLLSDKPEDTTSLLENDEEELSQSTSEEMDNLGMVTNQTYIDCIDITNCNRRLDPENDSSNILLVTRTDQTDNGIDLLRQATINRQTLPDTSQMVSVFNPANQQVQILQILQGDSKLLETVPDKQLPQDVVILAQGIVTHNGVIFPDSVFNST